MSKLDSYQSSLLKSIRAQVKGVLEGIAEDGYSAGNLVFDYLTDASRMLESLYAYELVPEPPCDCLPPNIVDMNCSRHWPPAPSVSEEQPAEVWPRDGDLCANCGRSEEECDCHPHPFTPAKADGTPMASPVISYNYPDDRERSAGRIDPQRIGQTNHDIKERMKNLAPHRATITMIRCDCGDRCEMFLIEVDGVTLPDEKKAGCVWTGTHEQAKAKMESLGK